MENTEESPIIQEKEGGSSMPRTSNMRPSGNLRMSTEGHVGGFLSLQQIKQKEEGTVTVPSQNSARLSSQASVERDAKGSYLVTLAQGKPIKRNKNIPGSLKTSKVSPKSSMTRPQANHPKSSDTKVSKYLNAAQKNDKKPPSKSIFSPSLDKNRHSSN